MPRALGELLSKGTLEDAYTVTQHLGAGAFSEVKLATRKMTGTACAVKILKRDHPEFNEVSVCVLPSSILPGPDTRWRFQELLVLEIEFMMRCKDHPNIVEIYDVYADKESVNIVMERV